MVLFCYSYKMEIKTVSLKDYSSLKIGGEGKLVTVTTQKELIEVVFYAKREGLSVHILGGGTNTFFGSSLQNVLVIEMAMKGVSFEEQEYHVLVTAHAGVVWDDLVQFAVEKNLWGIENLSYIPGTVGAAPVQNIGAYGVELKDTFVSLSALDMMTLNIVEISNAACDFGYRESLFKHEIGRYFIISVTLKLSKNGTPILTYKPLDILAAEENLTLEAVRDLVVKTRKAKLPDWKEYPNTGSFFKNPVVTEAEAEGFRLRYQGIPLIPHQNGYKIPAAWLIEHIAHMKGVRVGDIGTWPNQPLVIVNYGKATADELAIFVKTIIQKIEEKTGIILEKEVNCVGV
jgi:UDP-N-acetylmuramate dehydrogenase